ncbi:hypothetical protein [Clostridium sp. OS1-26]|uniref:hypothetical protein n=1 Tax=Clostridium sp. OS1-26 TaxID=3070681 RepID=UPI0027DF705D|nr:hypothetical protein [Clostridium sp. OS1-26]WML33530.1 hypothetical protein RCG18_19590 [Clostridium sp. OS1-26]
MWPLRLSGVLLKDNSKWKFANIQFSIPKANFSDELSSRVLSELESLFQSDLTSKEKIFAIHRRIACALKESATWQNYTCPIRLTAVILNHVERPVFQHIHFSFPCYWILEGKMDSL